MSTFYTTFMTMSLYIYRERERGKYVNRYIA